MVELLVELLEGDPNLFCSRYPALMGSIVGIFTATDQHLDRNLLLRMGNAITYSGSDDSYLDIKPEDGVALAHVPLIRRD
ncbi:MAG: hypothetical protein F6J98_23505, partial [Moorea sp. SIO4G2]|nr:hypothetical protein [Moorena sp. SIO4G2]